MVNQIRIYFEGHKSLKQGFHIFFSELVRAARSKRCRFELISTDGTPVEDYRIALVKHPDAWNVLLLDSDGPDFGGLSVTLCRKERLEERHAGSVFWMVQIMEAWFLADGDGLARYYGPDFRSNALPPNPNVEEIGKADVYRGLKAG